MRRPFLLSLGFVCSLGLVASSSIYGQGRGGPPAIPPQAQGAGNFPGFPSNAGLGKPADLPGPNENANGAAGGFQTDFQATSIEDQLTRTPKLATRLESMLTMDGAEPFEEGTTLSDMADGFPNLGLFVATVQLANNHEVDFDLLKANMLDGEGMSLGEALQAETDLGLSESNQAADEAEQQAEELIDENS
jgi:hypothetical protein